MCCLPLAIYADNFTVGKDYEIVKESYPLHESKSYNGKVPVIEFFSFGCPSCYFLEAKLNEWLEKRQDKILFTKVPVIFNSDWSYYAKAYYVAKLLGLSSKVNAELFKAIQDGRRLLNSNQEMIDFFINQGTSAKIAKNAFENSTILDMLINEGFLQMSSFKINAVPAIIVNNKYKTNLKLAQNETRLFAILDFLVSQSLLDKK